MKSSKAVFILVLILGIALTNVYEADAQDAKSKLRRGIGNLTTGWMEIPKSVMDETQKTNLIIGATWGLLSGLVCATGRTAVGACEVATFPAPLKNGYEPIIEPEFAFSDMSTD